MSPESIIQKFELSPHPEGGFYREAYRSTEMISGKNLPARFSGERRFSTAIYYLLPEGKSSKLHRIQSDEIWHFYLGGPLTIECIDEAGNPYKVVMGQNVTQGEQLQCVVPARHWFGAYPNPGSGFSFVGCTVAPGFDFADFEMGDRVKLLSQFPKATETIHRLT